MTYGGINSADLMWKECKRKRYFEKRIDKNGNEFSCDIYNKTTKKR